MPLGRRDVRRGRQGGHAACLDYAVRLHCLCDRDTWVDAAAGGSTQCLDILQSCGCQDLESAGDGMCAAAVATGHLSAVEWVMERTMWDAFDLLKCAARRGRIDYLTYILDRAGARHWTGTVSATIVAAAARGGQVDCLRLLVDSGYSVSVCAYIAAARNARVDCLRYLCEARVSKAWLSSTRVCEAAASKGNLDCLRYAHENGCRWGRRTVSAAAYGGHLDCLAYAIENGCPYDAYAVEAAARSGKLRSLQYLYSVGAPVHGRALRAAVTADKVVAVQFLLDNGCPIDCTAVSDAWSLDVRRLLRNAGCRRIWAA